MNLILKLKRFFLVVTALLWFLCNICYGDTIKIVGENIINKPTVYTDVTLDLSQGYFTINNNASLELKNCKVNGVMSANIPALIRVTVGSLILENNSFEIDANSIPSKEGNASIYNAINVAQGNTIRINNNSFTVNKPYTVGLFVTGYDIISNIQIVNNKVHQFHGGFFLSNVKNSLITYNKFSNVSISNILTKNASGDLIENNTMLFPGNNSIGDGIDILDSSQITVRKNYIASSSCYSIYLLGSKDILIEDNKINAGVTYAVFIASSEQASLNQNITVTNNYFAQNRFGLAADNVDGLIVENNFFIQKFSDNSARTFWTDNTHLLIRITNLAWVNNLYKEAYIQKMSEDNILASAFVVYPEKGGVKL